MSNQDVLNAQGLRLVLLLEANPPKRNSDLDHVFEVKRTIMGGRNVTKENFDKLLDIRIVVLQKIKTL